MVTGIYPEDWAGRWSTWLPVSGARRHPAEGAALFRPTELYTKMTAATAKTKLAAKATRGKKA